MEEHDGEEDEAATLIGRRRHDGEWSWTWRDTKKRSVRWNAIGGGSSLHHAKRDRGQRDHGCCGQGGHDR